MKRSLPRLPRLPHAPAGRLITVDAMSDVGNQFVALSLVDWLVFKGDQPLISIVLLCLIHQVPSIVLSPLAGRGVDRLGARTWLILINSVKCLLAGALMIVGGAKPVFILYLGFVTASLFFSIGRLSLVPLLIPRDRLVRFNALNERIAIGVGILSPWLIGLVLARAVPGAALVLTMSVFTVTVLLLTGLPRVDSAGSVSPDVLSTNAVGTIVQTDAANCRHRGRAGAFFSPLLDNPALAGYFLLLGFVIFGGGILNLGLPLFFKTTLKGDIARWGLILSSSQGGAFLSTLLLPRWSPALRRGGLTVAGFLVLGVALFLLPFSTSYFQVAALMAVLGFGLTMLQVFWETLIQQNADLPSIGKTMALLSSYQGVCYLSTILVGALISGLWGAELFFVLGALIFGSAGFMVKRC